MFLYSNVCISENALLARENIKFRIPVYLCSMLWVKTINNGIKEATKVTDELKLRFDALTGLRWLAASMVFVYHNRKYWRGSVPKPVLLFMNEFDLGVAVFFVLSGFLIAWTYGSKPMHSKTDYLKYFLLRAVRILPLYWLILTARYVDYGLPKNGEGWFTYTLFQGFSGRHNLDAIAQSWTLSVEMTFYLLAPLLFFLWNKSIYRVLVFLLLAGTLAALTGFVWQKINGNPQQILYPFSLVQGATFFGRFPEFLAGMWLARKLQTTGIQAPSTFRFKTSAGLLGLIISTYLLALCEPNIFSHGSDSWMGKIIFYTLIPFFITLFIYGLIIEKTLIQRFFSMKVMVLLGNASYAFYLIHISYVNIRLRGWYLGPDRNYILLWVIAILLYLLFEKPVYAFIRRKLYS